MMEPWDPLGTFKVCFSDLDDIKLQTSKHATQHESFKVLSRAPSSLPRFCNLLSLSRSWNSLALKVLEPSLSIGNLPPLPSSLRKPLSLKVLGPPPPPPHSGSWSSLSLSQGPRSCWLLHGLDASAESPTYSSYLVTVSEQKCDPKDDRLVSKETTSNSVQFLLVISITSWSPVISVSSGM